MRYFKVTEFKWTEKERTYITSANTIADLGEMIKSRFKYPDMYKFIYDYDYKTRKYNYKFSIPIKFESGELSVLTDMRPGTIQELSEKEFLNGNI